MVKNRKAYDWLEMAIDDIRSAEVCFKEGLYASTVYHSQIACEKAVKALITALGYIPSRSHRPSVQLMRIIEEKPGIDKIYVKYLRR